jgi:hypothetical protein
VITVHFMKVYDFNEDTYVISSCKRTADDIAACGGKPVVGSGEQVDASALDWLGRYYPPQLGSRRTRPPQADRHPS